MIEKNRRQPAHLKIAKNLGIAIVTGAHPPYTTLPGELDYAHQLGVSRNVVREALRTLSAKGLLESRPKAGTKIRGRHDWNLLDPELLGWMFEGEPPLEFVQGLFELRMIIEPAAAELAAVRRTARQLSGMGHELEKMGEVGLGNDIGRAADQRFHAIILEATCNELLVSLSASISAAVRWTTFFKYRVSKSPRDPMPQHRALFEAIADADPSAAHSATATLVREAQVDTEAALGSLAAMPRR
ncbi:MULTISPECIES: FadR/GntR family transcriptional regulator [unclassified Sphingomonas]|uniref:FadR/GntR family transcriptional regulator n=1 Tax=unclassified Sphingomonas TaxID=196159 RepID=UPI001F57EFE3|nr:MULTISPECIES: FadR/GntR family transcriptional regulator [unclassified Sphingomonas]